jgi:GT2 family glycosyltransferase
MKIAVVMPVVNQFERGIKALQSITVDDDYIWTPFIIDNWNVNKGVAAAWNYGTKLAIKKKYDYILIANDDIILSKFTLNHMVKLMSNNDDIGVLTSSNCRDLMTLEDVVNAEFPNYENDLIDAPDFSCFMITPETYFHIGEFDEGFNPAYFEDNDYCYRTILSGMKCVRSQNAMFYHYGSLTQKQEVPVVSSSMFDENKQYFINKWGGEPGHEVHTIPWNNQAYSWTATKQSTSI